MCSFAFNGEKNADFNRCFDNYLLLCFAPLTKYYIVVVKYNG